MVTVVVLCGHPKQSGRVVTWSLVAGCPARPSSIHRLDKVYSFCGNAAQRKATEERGPVTEPEPRTYTLSRAISPSRESLAPSPYVLVIGVPLYRDRLKIYASRLVLCQVMVVGSAGYSV